MVATDHEPANHSDDENQRGNEGDRPSQLDTLIAGGILLEIANSTQVQVAVIMLPRTLAQTSQAESPREPPTSTSIGKFSSTSRACSNDTVKSSFNSTQV